MRKIVLLAAFAAVTGATTAFAQNGGPPGPGGRGRGPGGGGMMMDRMLLEGITLTEAQQAKLQELRKAERERAEAQRGQQQGPPPEMQAIREAREECGLDVRLDGLVNIYSYPGRAPVIVVYAATALGGTLCVDDEGLETAEFEPKDIPWEQLAFRSTHEGLRDYLSGARHPIRR